MLVQRAGPGHTHSNITNQIKEIRPLGNLHPPQRVGLAETPQFPHNAKEQGANTENAGSSPARGQSARELLPQRSSPAPPGSSEPPTIPTPEVNQGSPKETHPQAITRPPRGKSSKEQGRGHPPHTKSGSPTGGCYGWFSMLFMLLTLLRGILA